MNAASSRRPIEVRENTPPPIENLAAQTQVQDLEYVDLSYYNMANDYPPPHGHGNYIRRDNPRIFFVQDVPTQTRARAAPLAPVCTDLVFRRAHAKPYPPPKVIDAFNDELQQAATGPAPTFNEFPDWGPVPNRRASEVLRQLAILYLNDPNSQLAMIHMEPGYADGVMVVITLKLTDL